MELDRIYNMDCLEGMKQIPDGTIDAVICDLPYGTTENEWDAVIPFGPLWEQYLRVCKKNAPIVLFSQMPFTVDIINSQRKLFRYEWIWQKEQGSGFMNANRMPLKIHENILVFYQNLPVYNPQREKSTIPLVKGERICVSTSKNYNPLIDRVSWSDDGYRMPNDIIVFPRKKDEGRMHPTQKPVDLLRYLVLTYTNEGDTVLDNCMGSGTTAIACIKERRHFIGFELSKEYFDKAVKRIKTEQAQLTLF